MIFRFAAALLLAAPLHAQDAGTAAGTLPAPRGGDARPTLTIERAPGPIRVDGDLSDPGWAGAARVTRLVEFQPREDVAPPGETEVWVTYDATHLYLAFQARDPNPGQIRATLAQRDQIWEDDWVGVVIDPRGDATTGYMIFANPLGVQGDMQATQQGDDPAIDYVYQSAGQRTADGYVVEIAIPFSTLRFPDRDEQRWRITFARNFPRSSRHMASWAPLSQNNPCMLCQLGTLEGISGIRAGGTLELLPAVVASQAGRLTDPADPGSFRNGRVRAEPSLGAKYVFRSGWTAEATLNPDFSQVESDAAQVDVNTTFALFYPERRPFFQEGMDLYETRMTVFYSRSINAPTAAAKVTGHLGRTTIGYVGARDESTPFILPFEERSVIVQGGPSVTNVVRLRRALDRGSHVGAVLTDRRLEGGGSGTTASVDGLLRFGEVYRLSAHLVASHTVEPEDETLSARIPDLAFGQEGERTARFDGESYAGRAASVQLARSARVWSWNVNYLEASPTYRADAGFQTRNDFRRVTGWTGVDLRPGESPVELVHFGLGGGRNWNFRGEGKEAWINPSVSMDLPGQSQVGTSVNLRRETFREIEFDGLHRTAVWARTRFTDALALGVDGGGGRAIARNLSTPEPANERFASFWATLKPARGVVVEPSVERASLHRLDGSEIYSGYVARTRVNLQYNRELQFRTVVQYDDFSRHLSVEPLLVYRVNPFTLFYLGSSYGSREMDERGMRLADRQYFAKFQYLFRR